MADEATDILMRVVGRNGPFKAESSTQFSVNPIIDTLRRDFEPGFICELRDFSLSARTSSALDEAKKQRKLAQDLAGLQGSGKPGPDPEGGDGATATGEFGRKRAAILEAHGRSAAIRDAQNSRLAARARSESVEMQEVGFTRAFDSSSTLLFRALCECETLESVSIVKRKASGSLNSGVCYLRLDFGKVLLTELTWKEDQGHVMLETGSFIYRTMTLRYRPQKPDGSLGPVVPAEWTMRTW